MSWRILFFLSIALIISYKLLPGIFGVLDVDPRLFEFALKDTGFQNSFRISIIWAFFNSFVLVSLATALSWTFRERKDLLMIILIIPWTVPMYLSVLVWRFSIFGIGGDSILDFLPNDIVTNPMVAFLWSSVVNIWVNLPFLTMAISSAGENVPKELLESASLDGATDSEEFLNVYLPVVLPTVSGWFLMEFVRFVHSFTVPYLLTEGGPAGIWGMEGFEFVGSTTTLGVYNFSIFKRSMDLDTLNAFSSLTLVVVGLMVVIWLFRNREKIVLLALTVLETIWIFGKFSTISLIFLMFLIFSILFKKIRKIGWIFPTVAIISMSFDFFSFDSVMLVYGIWLAMNSFEVSRVRRLKFPIFKIIGISTAVFLIFGSVLVVLSILSTLSEGIPEPIPRSVSFKPFENLFKDGYARYLENTLYLSIPLMILSPFLAFPIAYFISRKRSNFLMTLFITLQALGGIHMLSFVYSVYSKLRILNELTWLIPMICANVLPKISVSMKGFIDEIDRSIEDLAILDGGKPLAMKIVFRLSLPAVFVGSILGFSAGWNAFLAPMMLIVSEDKYPISVKLFDYAGDLMGKYPRWDLFGAGAVVNLAVIFSFFLITRFIFKTFEVSARG